ncbi:MAG TPA: hypothetical protein VHO90_20325 [Bacteroidales bacterium]|nr:hypothetical protein [Bacteroidales bacterium]
MRVQVALKLGLSSNPQVLIDGDRYVTCMTGNPHFADARIVAMVATCKTSVAGLRTAINAPRSDTRSDNIRIARDVLDRNLTMLGAAVEEVANNPAIPDSQREEIVHSAGMETKNQVHPAARVFRVINTGISGRVQLLAKGNAKAHQWKYTEDVINYTGCIDLESTTTADTFVGNLKKGKEYAFFHKPIKPKVHTEWEGPVLLLVS